MLVNILNITTKYEIQLYYFIIQTCKITLGNKNTCILPNLHLEIAMLKKVKSQHPNINCPLERIEGVGLQNYL